MFIRTKKRKNPSGNSYKYAYLVSNKYRKKGPKQKVRRYLGKVIEVEKISNKTFKEHLAMKNLQDIFSNKPLKTAILELLRLEFLNHGFTEASSLVFKKDGITADLKSKMINDSGNKNVYLAFNDGYLGSYTMSNAINFKCPEGLEKDIGKALARHLISAGILLDNETFLGLFGMLRREMNIQQHKSF